MLAIKNIVAQDQANRISANKIFTNDKSLRKSIGTRLFGVTEFNTVLTPIAQQLSEAW